MKDLKRLLPYIQRYRTRILIGFLFVTIANICATLVPRVVGNTIDLIKEVGFEQEDVLAQIVLIIALTAGSGIFMYLTRKTIIIASRMIEYDLRSDFLYAVQSRPMNFFHENPTGTLMAYATNDITAARDFLGPAIMYTANSVTTFIFALFFMLDINPFLTLLALSPLPVITFLVYKLGKEIHKSFKAVQEQFAEISARSQESFSGVRVVRAYIRENYENSIFKDLSKDYYRKNLRLAKVQASMMPALMVLVGAAQMIVLGYGGWQVMQGTATLGELTQFFIYINLLIWPVAAIGWITNVIQRASASMARLGKIFDEMNISPGETDEGMEDIEIKGNVKYENVSLSYGEESKPVLKNIDFSLKAGESAGFVGAVGSGKSSIVNLLPRLFDPAQGRILIDGRDINDIPGRDLRRKIAVVPQDQFLFSTTIKENIAFGKADADLDEIRKAAETACLDEEIEKFPDGYETVLGERGISLSGGQKQRLALARAVAKEPAILILDDALSAVDAQTEEKILANLSEFMKNRTTIIISHRINTVQNCDKIYVLDKGRIAERGTHEELILKEGLYYEMYARQKLEDEIEHM